MTDADPLALAREASSPDTAPARLAEIAHAHPEHRLAIAANPATYPGLLEWLVQFGDPSIDAIVMQRTGMHRPEAPAEASGSSAHSSPPAAPGPVDGLGIAAIVLAVLVAPVGLVIGVVAAVRARRARRSAALPLAAVVVGSILTVGLIVSTALVGAAIAESERTHETALYCARLDAYPDLFAADASYEKFSHLDDIASDQDARAAYYELHASDYAYYLEVWSDLDTGAPEEIAYDTAQLVSAAELTVEELENDNAHYLGWVEGPGGQDSSVESIENWSDANCS